MGDQHQVGEVPPVRYPRAGGPRAEELESDAVGRLDLLRGGYELDKWGEPVEKQPFPAKWSGKVDSPAPVDDRMMKPRNDIERKGDLP